MNEETVYLPSYFHDHLLSLPEPALVVHTVTDEADTITIEWEGKLGITVALYPPPEEKGDRRGWVASLGPCLDEMRARVCSGGRIEFTVKGEKEGRPVKASVYSIEVDGGS